MVTPKSNSTVKGTQTALGHTLKPAASGYPTVYGDDAWDIAADGTEAAALLGAPGTYTQHDINGEALSRYGRVFPTVAAMVAATGVPDGYVAYCTDTGLHYDYKASRTADPTLGKWRDTDGAATYLEHEWNLMELTNPGLRQQIMQHTNRIYIVRNSPVTPFTLTNTGASAATFQMVKTAGTGDTVGMWQYSLDGGTTWQDLYTVSEGNGTVDVAAGASVQIRAVDYVPTIYNDATDRYQLLLTGTSWTASGNVMSLLYHDFHDRFIVEEPMALAFLFYEQTALTHAADLALPATTLSAGCYYAMFYGCTGLLDMPVLPAPSLPDDAYYAMFKGCTSLTTIAALSIAATEACGTSCMALMFYGCIALEDVECLYVVRATGVSAMSQMFQGCTALISCAMPYLTEAGAKNALYRMFYGCISLEDLTVGFTAWPTTGNANYIPTDGWLTDVAPDGTFVAALASTAGLTRDADHVPADWSIESVGQ